MNSMQILVTPEEAASSPNLLAALTNANKHAAEHADAIEQAREQYADDDLEIDDNPTVSPTDEGVWVSAWVWVPNSETEE